MSADSNTATPQTEAERQMLGIKAAPKKQGLFWEMIELVMSPVRLIGRLWRWLFGGGQSRFAGHGVAAAQVQQQPAQNSIGKGSAAPKVDTNKIGEKTVEISKATAAAEKGVSKAAAGKTASGAVGAATTLPPVIVGTLVATGFLPQLETDASDSEQVHYAIVQTQDGVRHTVIGSGLEIELARTAAKVGHSLTLTRADTGAWSAQNHGPASTIGVAPKQNIDQIKAQARRASEKTIQESDTDNTAPGAK